jgi:hypothetical protein
MRSGVPRAAFRPARIPRSYVRFQSSATSSAGGSGSSPLLAGVAGGVAAATVIYGVQYFSPSGRMARTIDRTAKEANKKYQEAATKLQQATPSADETIDKIKEFCYSYVSWVPGGRYCVDAVFKDIDTVRENHRDEADQLVNDAYKQFQKLSKSGLSMETASKAAEVLADLSKKVASLGGEAVGDVADNHPKFKQKYQKGIDQLKQMGEQYGPDAKKQIEETVQQVQELMKGGLNASNLDKAQKMVQDKVEQLKKLGDEAWKKGLEQAKPYLDKSPKLKELVEKNADQLKQGNSQELFKKLKDAAQSGNTGGFEDYVSQTLKKAKSKGSELSESFGFDQALEVIPNNGEFLTKFKQFVEVAGKHTDESEQLLRETVQDIQHVFEEKFQRAQEIMQEARKEAK